MANQISLVSGKLWEPHIGTSGTTVLKLARFTSSVRSARSPEAKASSRAVRFHINRKRQKQNFTDRMKLDPEVKCYMPGVPRATYMPYPFQIIQSQNDIAIAYEYATSNRVINMGKRREAAVDTWMGTSNGHWEGDTLVVDVTGLNGQSWFDRSGNFMTENVHIVERYTLADADHISYEATIDDSTIFTRPWKISLPLYRRKEQNAQLGEFKCVEFAEELIYGHLRKR